MILIQTAFILNWMHPYTSELNPLTYNAMIRFSLKILLFVIISVCSFV